MTLYNLRSPGTITKWDNDGNIEAQYEVSYEGCTCPAGHRHTCRHRQMLPLLEPLANTHWFLDWDNGQQVMDFTGILKSHYDRMTCNEVETGFLDRPTFIHIDLMQESIVAEGPLKQDTPASAEGMRCEEDTIPLPKGVQMLSFNNPAEVHNAIADAVGEPEAKFAPAALPWRRI